MYEVASFYHHFDIVREDDPEPPAITIRVCDGLSCEMEGASSLISNLQNSTESTKIRVQKVPCIGRCANAPAAQVGKRAVDNASAAKIVKVAEGILDPIIPKYQKLSQYVANGGYDCLKRSKPAEVEVSAVKIVRSLKFFFASL